MIFMISMKNPLHYNVLSIGAFLSKIPKLMFPDLFEQVQILSGQCMVHWISLIM